MTEALTASRLFFSADMERAEALPLGHGQALVYSRCNPEKDGPNQDAAAVLAVGSDGAVLAVADGVGGQPAGADAARHALEQLAAAVGAQGTQDRTLRESILDGFEAANRAVTSLGVGAGTTLAVVQIGEPGVRSYHVGDSAVLLVGQRGKLKHLTVAHSPVGYAVESGLIDEDEALSHEERHVVSNMIGFPEMKIEIGPTLRLAARDTLLVGSDGLFDNLRLEEITEIIRKGDLVAAADKLAERCRARMAATDGEQPGKVDDLTFILYRPGRS